MIVARKEWQEVDKLWESASLTDKREFRLRRTERANS